MPKKEKIKYKMHGSWEDRAPVRDFIHVDGSAPSVEITEDPDLPGAAIKIEKAKEPNWYNARVRNLSKVNATCVLAEVNKAEFDHIEIEAIVLVARASR